jgi:hypothetical protein
MFAHNAYRKGVSAFLTILRYREIGLKKNRDFFT